MKKVDKKIMESTNPEELYSIGIKYAGSGNYVVAVNAFKKAYSLGHIRSLSTAGCIIATRIVPGYTPSDGIKMIEEAISKGDTEAKEILKTIEEIRTWLN